MMTEGTYFVLKRDPGTGRYVVVTTARTIDIGTETDPRAFLRALANGTVLNYLQDEARTTGLSTFWATNRAQLVENALETTNAFVLDTRTLYSAPGIANLAQALANRNLFASAYDENHNLLPGRALPDLLNAAATEWRPPTQPPVEERIVSLGNDSELDSLKQEGQPKQVTPDALKGGTTGSDSLDPNKSFENDSGDRDVVGDGLPF